jgi:cell division protein ZapA (FtsZ GTPase activity inhibitor)
MEHKMSEIKTALDVALDHLQSKFQTTDDIRQILINKLTSTVNQMFIDPNNDAPRMQEVKLATIKTLDDLLKSVESSAVTNAKVQMQKRSDENSDAASKMVIEMLKNINVSIGHNTGTGVELPTNMSAAIKNACEQTKHPISEDELSVPEVNISE